MANLSLHYPIGSIGTPILWCLRPPTLAGPGSPPGPRDRRTPTRVPPRHRAAPAPPDPDLQPLVSCRGELLFPERLPSSPHLSSTFRARCPTSSNTTPHRQFTSRTRSAPCDPVLSFWKRKQKETVKRKANRFADHRARASSKTKSLNLNRSPLSINQYQLASPHLSRPRLIKP